MRLTKLIAYKFNRLALADITMIEWTLKELMQIVLGTNGCGKSELLRHSAPIPATKGEFAPGGYIIKHYEHNGHEIIFKSQVGKKESDIRHSFSLDGVELQPDGGGTAMVQKELARRHLGFDDALHEVISGRMLFTEMSPSKRGDIITRLSNTDLTYALKLYDKLKEKHRDSVGARKRMSEQLLKSNDQMLSLNVTEEMIELSNTLQEEITKLMQQRESDADTDNLERLILQESERIESSIKQAYNTFNNLSNTDGFKNSGELLAALEHVRSEIARLTVESRLYTDELAQTQKTLKELEISQGQDADALLKQKVAIEQDLAKLGEGTKPESGLDSKLLLMAVNDISDLIMEMGTCSLPELKPADIDNLKAQREEHVNKQASLTQQANQISNRLDVIRHAKESKCPKCGYVYKEGISDEEARTLELKGGTISNSLESTIKCIEDIDSKLNEYAMWRNRLNRIRGVTTRYPQLSHVWNLMNVDKQHICNPSSIQARIEHERTIAITWEEYCNSKKTLESNLANVNFLLEAALKTMHLGGAKQYHQRCVELDAKIVNTNKQLLCAESERKRLERMASQITNAERVITEVTPDIERLSRNMEDFKRGMFNRCLEKTVSALQVRLAGIQNAVRERQLLESKIEQLNEMYVSIEQEEREWDTLMKAMSPKNGLIASQLTGHISMIVGQMNTIIGQVWDYDLEVIPCGIESEDLNYIFPLMVKNDPRVVADVKKGSLGQKDIVNFAFTVMVMLQNGLTEYPLYIDELGSSFDEAHRRRLVEYINFLIDNHKVSQAFMVNHFADMYNSITSYESVVLDPTNIIVPEKFNTNVTIVS